MTMMVMRMMMLMMMKMMSCDGELHNFVIDWRRHAPAPV
jgi:hypothetical protein